MAESFQKDTTEELRDKTQKLERLLPYTGGDMDIARKILAGQEHDVYVIKGKFKSPDRSEFGIFVLFVNKFRRNIKSAQASVCLSSDIYKTRLSLPWKEFLKAIVEFKKSSDYNVETSSMTEQIFHISLKMQQILNIMNFVDRNEFSNLDNLFKELMAEHFTSRYLEVQLDQERTDSLKTEDAGVSDENLFQDSKKIEKKSGKEKGPALDPEMKQILDNSVEGSPGISAVFGKPIQAVQPGDVIKVRITDTSARGRELQKLFQAESDSGALLPLKGTVRYNQKQPDGRWLILVDLGGSTFLRIYEEVDSIKIALWDESKGKKPVKEANVNVQLLLLVAVFIFIATLAGAAFLFL